jgi:uncharacterized membrane protein (UPF0182 family)
MLKMSILDVQSLINVNFQTQNLDNFYRSFTVHLDRFTVDSD